VKRGTPVRQAATMFEVPRTTLSRKVSFPEKIDCTSGPPTVFSKEVEEEIVLSIIYRAERGNPITKEELLDSVQQYVKVMKLKTPFKEDRPGRHWVEGFFKRHPHLTIRMAQNLIKARADVSETDLREWFAEVQSFLEKKNLLDITSSQVFNCDETSIELCPKAKHVITTKGSRTVYKKVDSDEKGSFTTMFMYSADGTCAPPMVMYKFKGGVPERVLKNCPSDWGLGNSDSGWQTTETFYEYIVNVFYHWLLKNSIQFPVIIYLDGHSSHTSIPLIQFCRSNNIELIKLFPHSTHISQPLDVTFFAPFKACWAKTVNKWKIQNEISRLKKEHCAAVVKQTLEEMRDVTAMIKNGFKCTGLMPFNPNAIDYNIFNKKKKRKSQENIEQSPVINDDMELFEQSISSLNLLEEFQVSKLRHSWSGDPKFEGLFQYWLKLKSKGVEHQRHQEQDEGFCVIQSDQVLVQEQEEGFDATLSNQVLGIDFFYKN